MRLSVPDLLEENADLKKALIAERALADDLYHWCEVFVDADHEEAQAVMVRYREARPIVTKTGRVLTDDDIEALAAEAEAGYDVSHLKDKT